MPVAPHNIRVPACSGIDENTREELVDFGASNRRQENVRQVRTGEAVTRYGFAAMPYVRADGTLPSLGFKMFADKTGVNRVTETLRAESYSSKAQVWNDLGRMPEATCSIIDLPSMGISTFLEDVDATNGYYAVSWLAFNDVSTSGAFVAVVDQDTGSVMRAPEPLGVANTIFPMLLGVVGNYFVATQYDSVGTNVSAWYLDTTSATTIATGWVPFAAPLVTDASGGHVLHTLPHVSTPLVAMLYANTSGGANRLTLVTFGVAGVVQTQAILTDSVTPSAYALGGFATDTLWLTWNETTSIYAQGVSPFSITSTLAARAVMLTMIVGCSYLGIAGSSTTGKARVWATDKTVASAAMVGIKTAASTATIDGTAMNVMGVLMARKPFFYGGRYYSAFCNSDAAGDSSQNNFFVCDWTDDAQVIRPVANPMPNLASIGLLGQGKFVASATATQYAVGFGIKRSSIADGSAILLLDFADPQRWQTCAHGNSVFIAAAVPCYSDGVRIAEVGFMYRPQQPTVLTTGTGISTTNLTGWKYVTVYEETDADGNWCVSGVSDPSAGTGPVTNKTLAPQTAPLAITSRLSSATATARGVRIAFYRTDETGQAPYYRVGTVLNTGGFVVVQYLDAMPDSVLRSQPVLYLQPGVNGSSQDRRPPPSFSSIVSYNGMLVGASGSDIWHSAQNVAGEGAWFSPIWQIPIPGDGDITALAVMDGTLYVFKRSEIYALAGEPPSDNAASGGMGAPRRLTCDVGALSNVTCTTAFGVFFVSEHGIEALTRGAQTVVWVGGGVHETVDAYANVTSITVDPASANTVVLVELAQAVTDGIVSGSGRTLAFDLSTNRWISTDRRTSYSGVVDCPSQSACVIYTGTAYRYAWLTNTGTVHYEDRTTYLDANGSFVTPLIETAWFNGYMNEQRADNVSILFDRYSAAGLRVDVAYDYGDYSDTSPEDLKVWNDVDTTSQRQLEFKPRVRGETMKLRITATAPAAPTSVGTGQGFGFIGIMVDLAPKMGPTNGTLRINPALRR